MRWLAFVAIALAAAPAFADGALTASMSGRTLVISGDAGANTFVVESGGDTDSVRVTPTNGTTLAGDFAALTFTGVRNLELDTGDGADRADLVRFALRGGVKARLGAGDDVLVFTGTVLRGKVFVRGDAGADTIRTESAALFHGLVTVRGDGENDELQFVSTQFRSRVRVLAGSGDDHVLVQSVTAGEFGRFEAFASKGNDLVELISTQFGNDTYVDAGADADRLRVVSCKFTLDLAAFGGAGVFDVLSLEGASTYTRRRTFGGFEEGQPETP